MENGSGESKSMGAFARIGNIFMSPSETFESIGQKPLWWVPFIIVVVVAIALQLWLMNITMQDQIAQMQARGMSPEQMDGIQERMQGPMRYMGLVMAPVAILVIWLATAGLLLLGSNVISGGIAKYSQVFGVVAWSSLITAIGGILKSVLVHIQGTSYGVSTSLAALMPVPPMGEKPDILYQFLSKMDPFMAWQVVLWGMGLAVVSKIESKNGYIIAFSLWLIWIVISIALGQLLGNFM